MSVVTDVTVVLVDHRDKPKLGTLFMEHEGIEVEPVETQGSKVPGSYTYAFGLNYAKPELLEALLAGPWADGTVVFIDSEMESERQIKVFGPRRNHG